MTGGAATCGGSLGGGGGGGATRWPFGRRWRWRSRDERGLAHEARGGFGGEVEGGSGEVEGGSGRHGQRGGFVVGLVRQQSTRQGMRLLGAERLVLAEGRFEIEALVDERRRRRRLRDDLEWRRRRRQRRACGRLRHRGPGGGLPVELRGRGRRSRRRRRRGRRNRGRRDNRRRKRRRGRRRHRRRRRGEGRRHGRVRSGRRGRRQRRDDATSSRRAPPGRGREDTAIVGALSVCSRVRMCVSRFLSAGASRWAARNWRSADPRSPIPSRHSARKRLARMLSGAPRSTVSNSARARRVVAGVEERAPQRHPGRRVVGLGREAVAGDADGLPVLAFLAELLGELGEEPRARLPLQSPAKLFDAGVLSQGAPEVSQSGDRPWAPCGPRSG